MSKSLAQGEPSPSSDQASPPTRPTEPSHTHRAGKHRDQRLPSPSLVRSPDASPARSPRCLRRLRRRSLRPPSRFLLRSRGGVFLATQGPSSRSGREPGRILERALHGWHRGIVSGTTCTARCLINTGNDTVRRARIR